jgi:hypothetical protein
MRNMRTVSYPTLKEVEDCTDSTTLLLWYRFLPSPVNEEQRKIIDEICVQRINYPHTSEDSKIVGW